MIQAARELTHALQQPRFRGPLAQFHDDHLTSLCELSKIFHTIAPGVENIAPGVDTTINKLLPPAIPLPPLSNLAETSLQPLNKLPYNLRPRMSRSHYATPITEISSPTPPHVPHGYAQPPTNLGASLKVSQTIMWNLRTLYSLFLDPRSPNTNDLPTHVLSAATIPKKLNLTAHASPYAATSPIILPI